MCTCRAPASLSMATILSLVVPLTMESSTTTTRLSLTTSAMGLSFILTRFSLALCPGDMKVRPIYRFFTNPTP